MEVEPELPIAPLQKTQEEGDQMYAQAFQQKSDEDELPVLPNSTCKMRAGCRGLATYKNSKHISCAQHATSDIKPFNPSTERGNKFWRKLIVKSKSIVRNLLF